MRSSRDQDITSLSPNQSKVRPMKGLLKSTPLPIHISNQSLRPWTMVTLSISPAKYQSPLRPEKYHRVMIDQSSENFDLKHKTYNIPPSLTSADTDPCFFLNNQHFSHIQIELHCLGAFVWATPLNNTPQFHLIWALTSHYQEHIAPNTSSLSFEYSNLIKISTAFKIHFFNLDLKLKKIV